ncbi:MAG: hypothetical protein WC332_02365 [Clostridia bacterium]|jgi:cob(I)alamin adenosyltransferase
MSENTVTTEQLADYLKRTGRSGVKTLSTLGYFQPFVDAINSPIGKELLKDALTVSDSLLMKIGDLTATPEETMQYKAMRAIILRWSERIDRYEKSLAELTNERPI